MKGFGCSLAETDGLSRNVPGKNELGVFQNMGKTPLFVYRFRGKIIITNPQSKEGFKVFPSCPEHISVGIIDDGIVFYAFANFLQKGFCQ